MDYNLQLYLWHKGIQKVKNLKMITESPSGQPWQGPTQGTCVSPRWASARNYIQLYSQFG